MTTGQLELPLFEEFRSTADNPIPEQDRTHPAQMIIRHCGSPKLHASHAEDFWGCPGVPDVREMVRDRTHRLRPVEDVELP